MRHLDSQGLTRLVAIGLAFVAMSGQAGAHVSTEPKQAAAGAYQAVRFQVGHGCHDIAATTGVRIEMPPGLGAARPQPKAGWTLTIEHDQGGGVSAVTWTGRLPPDEFDEFTVFIRTPSAPGPLYFPAVQTCGEETEQWIEIPDPGEGRLSHPAPSLQLGPAATDGGHNH